MCPRTRHSALPASGPLHVPVCPWCPVSPLLTPSHTSELSRMPLPPGSLPALLGRAGEPLPGGLPERPASPGKPFCTRLSFVTLSPRMGMWLSLPRLPLCPRSPAQGPGTWSVLLNRLLSERVTTVASTSGPLRQPRGFSDLGAPDCRPDWSLSGGGEKPPPVNIPRGKRPLGRLVD